MRSIKIINAETNLREEKSESRKNESLGVAWN